MKYFMVYYTLYYPLLNKVTNTPYVMMSEQYETQENIEGSLCIFFKKYQRNSMILDVSPIKEITEYEYNELVPCL